MGYSLVKGSRGKAPRFAIYVGLRAGYGPNAKTHTRDEVVELVLNHLKRKAASGEEYLTGIVDDGDAEAVYAWPEGPGKAGGGHEPQVTYSGNVNPLYNASMSREAIEAFLNDLAAELGEALEQTRVYVEFAGEQWILQKEGSETPTGE